MADIKAKREELLKVKEELTSKMNTLVKEFEQGNANLNAIEGALMVLEDLEKESKTTDTTTKTTEDVVIESETVNK